MPAKALPDYALQAVTAPVTIVSALWAYGLGRKLGQITAHCQKLLLPQLFQFRTGNL